MFIRKQRNRFSFCAQTLIEYTTIIGIITLILIVMGPLVKRFTQGMIKGVADQIGLQNASDQQFNQVQGGYLKRGDTWTTARSDKRTFEDLGLISYYSNDVIETDSMQVTDLGYTEVPPRN